MSPKTSLSEVEKIFPTWWGRVTTLIWKNRILKVFFKFLETRFLSFLGLRNDGRLFLSSLSLVLRQKNDFKFFDFLASKNSMLISYLTDRGATLEFFFSKTRRWISLIFSHFTNLDTLYKMRLSAKKKELKVFFGHGGHPYPTMSEKIFDLA